MCELFKRQSKDILKGRKFAPAVIPEYLKIPAPIVSMARPAAINPSDRPWISKATIKAAIKREFGNRGYYLALADEKWRGYRWSDIAGYLLNVDDTDKIPFQSDEFDCDDFADVTRGNIKVALKGVQFGVIWMASRQRNLVHAVNFFYIPDYYQRCICFEPQTDTFYWHSPALWSPILVIA